QVNARHVQHLAQLLKTQGHVAAGHQRGHGHTGWRGDDAPSKGAHQTPALEQGLQRHPTGSGGITDGAGLLDRPAQRRFGAQIGGRGPLRHGDRHRGTNQIHPRTGQHVARSDQSLQGIRGQKHGIERLTGLHPPGRIHPADGLERQRHAGALPVVTGQ
ncbi:hypothetical protein RZS08_21120, partial [Arthrospira platensis SPKY1]|nr:hypothetical protein [Arthrospira platensis SPKY1]